MHHLQGFLHPWTLSKLCFSLFACYLLQGMLNNAPNGGSTAAALEQWVAAGGGSSSNASGSMAAAAAGLGSGRRPSLHAPSRSGSRSHVTSSVLHGGQLSKGPSGRGAPTEEAEEVDTLGKSMPSSLLSMRPSASQQHAVLMVQQAQLQAQAQLAQQLLQVRGGSSRPGSTGRPGSSGPAVSGQQPTTAPTAGGSSAGPTLYSATQLAVGASSAGRTSTGGGAGAAHSGPLPFPIQNTTSSQLLPNIASPFVAAGSIAEANQPAGNNSGPFVKLSQNTVTQLMVAGGSHGGAPPSPCPSEWQGWTNPGEEAGEMELVYALTGEGSSVGAVADKHRRKRAWLSAGQGSRLKGMGSMPGPETAWPCIRIRLTPHMCVLPVQAVPGPACTWHLRSYGRSHTTRRLTCTGGVRVQNTQGSPFSHISSNMRTAGFCSLCAHGRQPAHARSVGHLTRLVCRVCQHQAQGKPCLHLLTRM